MKAVVNDLVTQDWIRSYIVKCDQDKAAARYVKRFKIHEVDIADRKKLKKIEKIETSKESYFTKISEVNKQLVAPQIEKVVDILQNDKNPSNTWIVFTHYIEIQGGLKARLTEAQDKAKLAEAQDKAKLLDYHVVVLNGSTDVGLRHRTLSVLRMRKNKTKETVIIASIRCMGEGCDIQFANRTIHIWPPMNPSEEIQAMGRIDRPGQTSENIDHHFVTCNTGIEKNLLKLNKGKVEHMKKITGEIDQQYLKYRYDKRYIDDDKLADDDDDDDDDKWRKAVLKTLKAVEKIDLSKKRKKSSASASASVEDEYEIMLKRSKDEFESFWRTSSCSCGCCTRKIR
jgi:superfamily II DNA/RNA helicase